MLKKIYIDREKALKTLVYDKDTGAIYRKGKIAGTPHSGYIRLRVGSRPVYAHRLIWVMLHGELDEHLDVDHINGIKNDNRLCNLRVGTRTNNQQNQRSPRGKNPYLGVSKWKDKFQASIKVGTSQKYLGIFSTPEEAHLAYLEQKRKHHTFGTI